MLPICWASCSDCRRRVTEILPHLPPSPATHPAQAGLLSETDKGLVLCQPAPPPGQPARVEWDALTERSPADGPVSSRVLRPGQGALSTWAQHTALPCQLQRLPVEVNLPSAPRGPGTFQCWMLSMPGHCGRCREPGRKGPVRAGCTSDGDTPLISHTE